MAATSPLHRHQSSLEGVIDFSTSTPLGPGQRNHVKSRFYRIIAHFEVTRSNNSRPYNPTLLIRYTYEYALSEESRDTFLRAFFQAMSLSIDEEETIDFEGLHGGYFGFADYLLDNFYLPLKASARKTPQPSPAYHSAVQAVQGGSQEFIGTPDRVSTLRGDCLIRDRHRCVISRKYDANEAATRFARAGDEARDDDAVLLVEDPKPFDVLEVAHILPHSLIKSTGGSRMDSSREAALSILNMFDIGVRHLIEGPDIDRPRNAISLTHTLHNFFGDFKIFFEPLPGQHTYQINSFLPRYMFRDPAFPVTRTLYLTEGRTIDPPSPRLLAIHRAIAHVLHLSAAGDYIDTLLRDMEEKGVQEDGSTELDRLLKLRLGGWLKGTVCS